MTDEVRRDYYVYALIDPRNDQPFYIGKGTGKRVEDHYRDFSLNKTYYNPHKNNLIKKYRKLGYKDKYIIYQNGLTEQQALFFENKYIILFGRFVDGGCLTNFKLEEISAYIRDKESWRKAISKTKRENPYYHPPEIVKRINDSKRGVKRSPEVVERMKEVSKRAWEERDDIQKILYENRFKKTKWYKVTFPNNKIMIIRNLNAFCQKYGFTPASVVKSMKLRPGKPHKKHLFEFYIPTEKELQEDERSGNIESFEKVWKCSEGGESS